MSAIIRANVCKNCKFRETEPDGRSRCHFGPPQRSVFPAPTPQGFALQTQVAFPEVLDDWFCHQHKPRLAVAS